MQKAKGITLVSLIITVIIMLILAGVSISVLFDPKGVIERGKVAAEEANISNYSEALQNIGLVLMPEKVEKKLSGKSYMDRYEEEARKEAEGGSIDGATVTRQNDETVRVVTEEGYVFDVTEKEVKYVGKQGETPAPPAIIETDLEFKTNPEKITNKDVIVTIVPKITIDENYTIQYVQKNLNEEPKETEWKNYVLGTEIKFTQKGNVFVRLINNLSETGQSFTHTVNNIDKEDPNTFTATAEPVTGNKSNSIIVKGHTTDKPETTQYACSGIKEYYFKQVEASDNSETIKQSKDWGEAVQPDGDNDVSKTFEGLTQNGTYYFVIKAVDNAGNETITEKVQASTDEVPGLDTADITFDVSPTTWTNSVTVTINLTKTFAGYTLQYAQKDKDQVPSDKDWTTCSSGQEVTLTKNGNVFARLIDNNKQEGTMIASQDISNIDTTSPEGDSSGITTTVTDTQIETKLNVTDAGGSGLAKVEWKYSAKDGGMGTLAETNSWSELHTDVSKPGETSKQASTTITGLIGNTEYDIKAIIYDVAGNTNEVTRLAVKTNPTPVTGITVTPTELSLGENETAKLTATVQPPNATDKTVTWRSEDDQTATVEDHKDGTATVTGVKAGNTNIVATAGEQSVKCKVEVKANGIIITKDNYKNYLGKVVTNFRPEGTGDIETVTNSDGEYIVGTKYRLYYVDFDNKYGDGYGSLYLKADTPPYSIDYLVYISDLGTDTIDINETKVKQLSPELYKIGELDEQYLKVQRTKWLLNPIHWNDLKINSPISEKVNYVVGAPTLEMMYDSYNTYYNLLSSRVGDEFPYRLELQIKQGNYGLSYETDHSMQLVVDPDIGSMYYGYYFIASPAVKTPRALWGAFEAQHVMEVDDSGLLAEDWDYFNDYLCPVVSLKPSTQLEFAE